MLDTHVIIERPLVTEKSVAAARADARDRRKYAFKVHGNATKVEISKAVAEKFKVKVLKVNTVTVRGKTRRVGRFRPGRTATWKKAIVTLAPGHKIPLFEGM